LLRSEGGELGLSRILFEEDQKTPTFWCASDEGELAFVDWSIRPVVQGEENRPAEYIQRIFESERNSRPVLALERSPFYDDLLLTVHDYHFAIWKISLTNREEPIFRSANSRGS
jgi:dynein intermediate chain 3, axonemal